MIYVSKDAKKQWWEKSISIEEKKLELAPRLAVKDLEKILPYSLVLDIRPESEQDRALFYSFHVHSSSFFISRFVQGHIPSSMNVQAAQLMSYTNVLKKLNRKYHVVIANEAESNGPSVSNSCSIYSSSVKQIIQYAAELVKKVFPRVVLLQGGIEAYKSTDSKERVCSCRPQKQTTAGFKGKGSEPPFVMWRCKVPPPLKKK